MNDRFRMLHGYHYEDNTDGTFQKSVGKPLRDYRIYGNSIQDGTPSPDNPIEIQSIGDLITDENDENYGKYKIPIIVSSENQEITETNIYLDEPLRKVGDYADYIDFKGQKVVRNVGKYIADGNETSEGGGTNENSSYYGFAFKINNSSQREDVARKGLCNYLIQSHVSPNPSSESFAFLTGQNHPYVYIYILKESIDGVYESQYVAVKEFLKQRYDEGNPLVFYYAYEIATEETIDLPQILTHKGTNIITVGTDIQPGSVNYQYYKGGK